MSLYQGIFKRDMQVAFKQKAELVQPLMFLLMVVTLFPLGVSPSPDTLQRIGPGVIWIAAILSSLMAMERLFRDDFQDGSLEQYMLSGMALPAVSVVKVAAHWLVSFVPLLLLSPLLAMFLNLTVDMYIALVLTLILGTPLLSLIGAIAVGLTVGLQKGGVLLALLLCRHAFIGCGIGTVCHRIFFKSESKLMWKWLHPYAKTERAYQLCLTLQPWFWVGALACLSVGTVWGLAFAPQDYQQGDSFRIIYIHVPSAILSMGTYVAMAIAALVGMVWQWRTAYMSMIAMAPIGAVMTFIALFTGAAWGKPMWGAWWVWDARLTSELILLFLYMGVIALYGAFEDKQQAGKAAGVMALVGVVNIPIIHYSVEWWNTLHQGATISKFDNPSIAPEMLWPLLINLLGFAFFIGAVTTVRLRNEIVLRELHRPWVQALAAEKVSKQASSVPNANLKEGN